MATKTGRPRRPLSERKNLPAPSIPRLIRCSRCGERKHQSNFYYKAGSGQLMHHVCRPCLNLRMRELRAQKAAKRRQAEVQSSIDRIVQHRGERQERVTRALDEAIEEKKDGTKRLVVVSPNDKMFIGKWTAGTNGQDAASPLTRLLDIDEPANERALRRLVNQHPVDYLTLLAEELTKVG